MTNQAPEISCLDANFLSLSVFGISGRACMLTVVFWGALVGCMGIDGGEMMPTIMYSFVAWALITFHSLGCRPSIQEALVEKSSYIRWSLQGSHVIPLCTHPFCDVAVQMETRAEIMARKCRCLNRRHDARDALVGLCTHGFTRSTR